MPSTSYDLDDIFRERSVQRDMALPPRGFCTPAGRGERERVEMVDDY
jgi:hypothetical protein